MIIQEWRESTHVTCIACDATLQRTLHDTGWEARDLNESQKCNVKLGT
jgi:predicted nucleic acid-binding Zn ribbon protein